jgi:hypothetical protein
MGRGWKLWLLVVCQSITHHLRPAQLEEKKPWLLSDVMKYVTPNYFSRIRSRCTSENNNSSQQRSACPPKNASRWYLQVLDDGSRVLVCLGLAAEVASDGL